MASARVEPESAPLGNLLGAQTENEDILVPDMLANLDIGAVERADGQGAIQRQFHVAGSGSLHSRRSRSAPRDRPTG